MSLVFLNGEYVEDTTNLLHHRECGYTTGIGIFDSMLADNGTPVHIAEHHSRILYDTETVMGITPSLSLDKFQKICHHLLIENHLDKNHSRIRTTVSGGIVSSPLAQCHTPTILIDVMPAANPATIKPVTCVIVQDFPRIANCILENCKRLDYTRAYAARRHAENLGAEDAIITNTQGNIACGTTSNIFIEEKGVLITPPLTDGVLAGITRRKLMDEREVKEESISIERLQKADKIYFTNSFVGLREVILMN